MEYVDALTEGFPRVLLVRGTGTVRCVVLPAGAHAVVLTPLLVVVCRNSSRASRKPQLVPPSPSCSLFAHGLSLHIHDSSPTYQNGNHGLCAWAAWWANPSIACVGNGMQNTAAKCARSCCVYRTAAARASGAPPESTSNRARFSASPTAPQSHFMSWAASTT